jgi:hypothetical protein
MKGLLDFWVLLTYLGWMDSIYIETFLITVMSESLDICPRCNEGEMQEPFAEVVIEPNEQSSTTHRICNKCGYKEPYVEFTENVKASDSLGAERKRANAQGNGSSD